MYFVYVFILVWLKLKGMFVAGLGKNNNTINFAKKN